MHAGAPNRGSHVPPQVGDEVKAQFEKAGWLHGTVVKIHDLPGGKKNYDLKLDVRVEINRYSIICEVDGEYIRPCPPYKDHY